MLLPLRAAFVIGAIFYLSPMRHPLSPGTTEPTATAMVRAAATLPPQVRSEAARIGLEALVGSSLLLRAGLDEAAPSRDTLHEADRGLPWHGPAPMPPRR